MARRIKLRARDVALPPPPQEPKADQVLARLDDLGRRIDGIPAPDLASIKQELAGLRVEVAALAAAPKEWSFKVTRRAGRISEVTAVPADSDKPKTGTNNILNLYKKETS